MEKVFISKEMITLHYTNTVFITLSFASQETLSGYNGLIVNLLNFRLNMRTCYNHPLCLSHVDFSRKSREHFFFDLSILFTYTK